MKRPHAIETLALSIVEALREGRPPGDATASVFRAWPTPAKAAARLLAAHANAARGRDLLWLIGVDPAGAKPPRGAELARAEGWIGGVSDCFDGIAPRLQAFAIPLGGPKARQAVALHIETGRAPFVVRGAGAGLETPWWDGARVRSAGRLELVQLLSPLQELPGFEMLEADLSFYKNPHVSAAARETYRWTLDAAVYVLPQGEAKVILPLHRCRGGVAIAGTGFRSDATDLSLTADKNSPAVRITESAALVDGLGRFHVYCCGSTRAPALEWSRGAEVRLDFTPASSLRAATATATLRPEPALEPNQAGRWKL